MVAAHVRYTSTALLSKYCCCCSAAAPLQPRLRGPLRPPAFWVAWSPRAAFRGRVGREHINTHPPPQRLPWLRARRRPSNLRMASQDQTLGRLSFCITAQQQFYRPQRRKRRRGIELVEPLSRLEAKGSWRRVVSSATGFGGGEEFLLTVRLTSAGADSWGACARRPDG